MERLDLNWCGEVVGYLVGPRAIGHFLSGRWVASKSDLTGPFMQRVLPRRPRQKPERVDFEWEGKPRVADVTHFMNGEIGVALRHERVIFPR
jgi:hypothetical protein